MSARTVGSLMVDDFATSREVCEYAEITYRQLDYWTRTGLIESTTGDWVGSGHIRYYTLDQMERAAQIKDWLDRGRSLQLFRAYDQIWAESDTTPCEVTP